ncbi:hypothetical protein H5410_009439 [Solanum commersonii]|uniref:Uncharacterized protein n=1 Tax=Solanum commersonii TaxID=4109 RepID=A0A9J6AHV7_SOLCO|nr:hypothetical protein H5410_009439 [Solanum commersonii]
MSDAISSGKGQKKFVYLHNSCVVPSAPPITILKRDNKGKGTQEGNADIVIGYKRQLDDESFGVVELEQLLAKVKDVVVVQEEPVNVAVKLREVISKAAATAKETNSVFFCLNPSIRYYSILIRNKN